MPRKLIEKLTGSAKLTQEDLRSVITPENPGTKLGPLQRGASSILPQSQTLASTQPKENEIEELGEDFELPPEDEIETIEEVIEDDTISEEQVEEFYEVVEEEEATETPDEESNEQDEEKGEEVENEDRMDNDYPSFDFNTESDKPKVATKDTRNAFTEFEKSIERAPEPAPVLPVDIYELHHELIIRALIPGITPDNLKVSITRTHVTLSGNRTEPDGIGEEAYYSREIPSGSFHRVITLPVEADVEHAEAIEKYGMLIIRLPKVDSKKSQELKVRSA